MSTREVFMNDATRFVVIIVTLCTSFLSAQVAGTGNGQQSPASAVHRSQDSPSAAVVREIEQHIEEATVSDDTAFLEKVFADDFTYKRTTGESENKAQWLQTITRRPFIARKIVFLEIEVHGDVAITHGQLDMAVHDDHGGHSNLIKYLHVYQQRNGNWVLLTHRSLEETAKPLS